MTSSGVMLIIGYPFFRFSLINAAHYGTWGPSIQVRSVNSGDDSVIITSLLENEPRHAEALRIWEPIITGRDVAIMSYSINPPIPPFTKGVLRGACFVVPAPSMGVIQTMHE